MGDDVLFIIGVLVGVGCLALLILTILYTIGILSNEFYPAPLATYLVGGVISLVFTGEKTKKVRYIAIGVIIICLIFLIITAVYAKQGELKDEKILITGIPAIVISAIPLVIVLLARIGSIE